MNQIQICAIFAIKMTGKSLVFVIFDCGGKKC